MFFKLKKYKMLNKKNLILFLSMLFVLFSCDKKITKEEVLLTIKNDDVNSFNKIIKNVDIDTIYLKEGRNLLHKALMEDAFFISKSLIKKSKLINKPDSSGYTPLMLVLSSNYITRKEEIISLFLKQDIDFGIKENKYGMTALHLAIFSGDTKSAKKIIDRGANINLKTKEQGLTPLLLAIRRDNAEIVKYLIAHQANDTITDLQGRDAKDYVLKKGNEEMIQLYFDSYSKEEKNSILSKLIENENYTETLKSYLAQDWVDINVLNENFLFVQNTDIALDLIKKGVDVNYISKKLNYNALHIAAMRGDVAMIETLLKSGANINKRDRRYQSTPLMHAARLYNNSNLNSSLIKIGNVGNLIFERSDKKTAKNSLESVKLLIKNKAKIKLKNKAKKTALDYAIETKNDSVALYLRSR
jgi:ankyrin repeat protein